jgi:signal transduction histidine kinase/CheY-like chemotaxis protein
MWNGVVFRHTGDDPESHDRDGAPEQGLRERARALGETNEALRLHAKRLAAELDTAERLLKVSTLLIQADRIEALYERILDTAVEVLGSDFASLQKLHPERGLGGELRLLGYRGFTLSAARFWEWVQPASHSACGAVLATRRRCAIPDVEKEPRLAGTEDLAVFRETGIRAVQSTPLFSGDGVMLGVFSTHWREPHELTGTELRALDVLARQTADLIERAQAEEALRAREALLREADLRKGEFIAMLSHELRNPLAPIRNSLYVLDRVSPSGEHALRAKGIIQRQVDQLARLVDDLLDVTRMDRNKVQLRRSRLELNELVRQTTEDHRFLFDEAGVRLELHPAPAQVFVHADWNRVAQVVGNLLQNAAKFTPREGLVSVHVSTDDVAGAALVRVVDSGVGMSPETLARLFQPFMQAERSLDRSKGGLGLGLALVRGVVEGHGGAVYARSAGVGRGAELVVCLPLSPEAPADGERTPGDAATTRCRVLLIEDNADAAESLRDLLACYEHEVAIAGNGADGIAAARAFRPDVVLCDIGLPGMDGYDVARAFRGDEALKDTFLVALSGYALPEDLGRAAEAGFDQHLAKPPTLEMLQQVLRGRGA